MKIINYIDENFIEKMKKEKIAVKATVNLMKRLEELGIVWYKENKKPTEVDDWKEKTNYYVDLFFWGSYLDGGDKDGYVKKWEFELYEYQPKPQLSEKERIERAIEKHKTKIENLSKRLEELNKPKWDIYLERPNFTNGKKVYCVDLNHFDIGYQLWNSDDEDFDFFEHNIVHKTEESAELELAFRKELKTRGHKFEIDKKKLVHCFKFGNW